MLANMLLFFYYMLFGMYYTINQKIQFCVKKCTPIVFHISFQRRLRLDLFLLFGNY